MLATKRGQIKSLKTGELTNIRPSGLIVMNLTQDDELVSVAQVGEAKDAMMVTEKGQAIRFAIDDLTPRSRTAGGVRGIRLIRNDQVISMGVVNPNSQLLVVSQRGYGKMTATSSYRSTKRGGQGVRTFQLTEKAGPLAAARIVTDPESQEMLIISTKAQVVRISIDDVRETGRIAQGVILWKEREADDQVASIAIFQETDHTSDGPPSNGHRRNGRAESNGHASGSGSESESGSGSESDPGLDPSPNPGLDPSPNPGLDPSPNPGLDPSPNPGLDPSPNPGLDPSPNPGLDPSPNPSPCPNPNPNPSPNPNHPSTKTRTRTSRGAAVNAGLQQGRS